MLKFALHSQNFKILTGIKSLLSTLWCGLGFESLVMKIKTKCCLSYFTYTHQHISQPLTNIRLGDHIGSPHFWLSSSWKELTPEVKRCLVHFFAEWIPLCHQLQLVSLLQVQKFASGQHRLAGHLNRCHHLVAILLQAHPKKFVIFRIGFVHFCQKAT